MLECEATGQTSKGLMDGNQIPCPKSWIIDGQGTLLVEDACSFIQIVFVQRAVLQGAACNPEWGPKDFET
jgi:hypothetical protein